MEFKFLDKTVKIPESIEKYQELLAAWGDILDEEETKIEEKYNAVSSNETLKNELEEWGIEFLDSILDKCILWLKEEDIVKKAEEICPKLARDNYLEKLRDIKEEIVRNVYSGDEVLGVIIKTIIEETHFVFSILLSIVSKERGCYIGWPSEEQREEVKGILASIENGEITGDGIKDALIKCIQLDGFNEDIYYYCLLLHENNADIDDDICDISDYFFVDIDDDVVCKAAQKMMRGKNINDLTKEECEDIYYFIIYYGDNDLALQLRKRSNEIDAEEQRQKYFKFLERDLWIPEETVTYVNVIGMYQEEASSQAKQLRQKYADAYNLDTVLKNIDAWGMQLLTETVQKMLQAIRSMGIYDIDMNCINHEYTEYINFAVWNDAVEVFAEKCAKCVYSEEQMKAYREQRKAQRGRFVGGGFGVSGAIKGSMQAGALNMATGAAHSVVNAFGNMASDARISANKSNLYKANGTINELCNALYEMVFSVQQVYMEIIYNELDVVLEPSFDKDRERAKALNNSVKSGVCSNDEIEELLIESIQCDFFNSETYALALEFAGDPYGYIAEMAEFFGVNVRSIKETMLNKYFSSIRMELANIDAPMSISAWEAGKNKLMNYQKWLKHTNEACEKAVREVDWELRVCYARQKIVNGKMYETKELADQAKKDLVKIYRIAEDLSVPIEEAIQNVSALNILSEDISVVRTEILESRRKLISGDLNEIEKELLKLNAEVFELPHKVARDSRCSLTIEEYLKDRLFVVNSSKFDKMLNKINKAITLAKDEKVFAFITELSGVMLNSSGLVITNKKVYFISYKDILFQAEWNFVDKIIAQDGRYIIIIRLSAKGTNGVMKLTY